MVLFELAFIVPFVLKAIYDEKEFEKNRKPIILRTTPMTPPCSPPCSPRTNNMI